MVKWVDKWEWRREQPRLRLTKLRLFAFLLDGLRGQVYFHAIAFGSVENEIWPAAQLIGCAVHAVVVPKKCNRLRPFKTNAIARPKGIWIQHLNYYYNLELEVFLIGFLYWCTPFGYLYFSYNQMNQIRVQESTPFPSSILVETRFEPTCFWSWVEFVNH